MFKTSVLYEANKNESEDVIVNQGGSSSGKTYSILQVLFTKAIEECNVITIAGQDIPNLKAGALRDALDIYNNSPILQQFVVSYNITDRIFKFDNGSIMEFKSFKNSQDAKSGKRDYLFINEANGIPYDVYFELEIRTKKQTYIDYNPNCEFWVHEKVIGQPRTKLFISDHRHNPFVQQKIRDKLEALKELDLELFKVYGRGLTGKIEGLIFRNYNVVNEIPKDATLIANGGDFGFTNDPTAMLEVYKQNGELWINELIYETGLTNPMIADKIKGINKQGEETIFDSAEPKSIQELTNQGIRVFPAKKGADSIKTSIDVLKRYKLNVTITSVNLRKELNSYKWAVDKDGKSTNEPVDYNNHLIDALRYVALNKLMLDNNGVYAIR
jgi:phage terminase large subunit